MEQKTRREILDSHQYGYSTRDQGDRTFRHLVLEVLLDIRELLSQEPIVFKGSAKHLEPMFGPIAVEQKRDDFFDKAVAFLKRIDATYVTTDSLRRDLKVTHGRASALMNQLEEAGIISAGERGKPRKVL